MFNIIQKKGEPDKFSGRVIGYVKILPIVGNQQRESGPFDLLISPDGFLAIQGDYLKIPDLGSFGKSLSPSLPQGLQDMLKKILEDDDLKDIFNSSKIKNINVSVLPARSGGGGVGGGVGEFFPVPAQLVQFKSEEEILQQDADIFYLGEFSNIGCAHMFLMGFPILYQSKFKESEKQQSEKEVDALLSELGGAVSNPVEELNELPFLKLEGNLSGFNGDLLDLLMQTIQKFMYSIENGLDLSDNIKRFRKFMHPYPYQQDLDQIQSLIENIAENKGHSSANQVKKLALLCQKINFLHKEEFEKMPEIQAQLEKL
ncbi:hypothetical protein AGMMS49938_03290 [Fibrobacterales bacterium]|nr:hypothetical protein AGMMS49938_03290 [Fibrobacterales bacterium]